MDQAPTLGATDQIKVKSLKFHTTNLKLFIWSSKKSYAVAGRMRTNLQTNLVDLIKKTLCFSPFQKITCSKT